MPNLRARLEFQKNSIVYKLIGIHCNDVVAVYRVIKIQQQINTVHIFTGTLGMCGNLWVITVISSSQSMRKKLINILFTNQSLLDFLCSLLSIFSCRVKTFVPEGGQFGIKGDFFRSENCGKFFPVNKIKASC